MATRTKADSQIYAMIKEKGIHISRGFHNAAELKKIIDGKTYNTRTASYLTLFTDIGPEEYDYVTETLYLTRTGLYFLVGEGATCSPWTYQLRDCRDTINGHGLLPLTFHEAKLWLELRELHDEYEEVFGYDTSSEESSGLECSILLRLPCSFTERLAMIADKKDCSRQQLLNKIIVDYLASETTLIDC